MFHMPPQGATLPSLTTRSLFFLNAEGTVRKKMFFRQRRFVLSTFTPQKGQVHCGAPASKTSFFPLNAGKKGEIIGTLQRIVRRQIENVPKKFRFLLIEIIQMPSVPSLKKIQEMSRICMQILACRQWRANGYTI